MTVGRHPVHLGRRNLNGRTLPTEVKSRKALYNIQLTALRTGRRTYRKCPIPNTRAAQAHADPSHDGLRLDFAGLEVVNTSTGLTRWQMVGGRRMERQLFTNLMS